MGSPSGADGLLTGYRPVGAAETADVATIRAMVDGTPDPWSRAEPLHLTGSALIVHQESGRVLLRWHEKMESWLQVGGHGDPGETDPLAVALREGQEESGLADLRPWPTAALLHAVVVSVPGTPHEPAHWHADLRFVLATATPDSARPEKPSAPLRWLTLPEALDVAAEGNLRETLARVAALLG